MKKLLYSIIMAAGIFLIGTFAVAQYGGVPGSNWNFDIEALILGKDVAPASVSTDTIINVMHPDYGATGDGTTSDRAAIVAALDAAVARWTADNDIKTTIYFPAGDYALINPSHADTPGGIQYVFPDGFGGLTLKGEGGSASRLLWTGNNPMHASSIVYALEFKPTTDAPSAAERLHDISIVDLGVYDDDPDTHEIAGGEETHGFIMRFVDRATYDGVWVDSCGDEYIIVKSCVDVSIQNCVCRNNAFSSVSASTNSGIDIMGGCENVVVTGCRIFSDENDQRGGTGIYIEIQIGDTETSNVVISNNVIQNCIFGISMQPGNEAITNVSVANNAINNCDVGIIKDSASSYNFKNISILGNVIQTVHTGILLTSMTSENYTYVSDINISGNTIRDVNYSASSNSDNPGIAIQLSGENILVSNNVIDDCDYSAIFIYNLANSTIKGCVINNVNNSDQTYAAIDDHASSSVNTGNVVDGVVLTDGQKFAVKSVDVVKNSTLLLNDDDSDANRSTVAIKIFLNNTVNFPVTSIPDDSQYIGNRFVYTDAADPGLSMLDLSNTDDGIFLGNYFEGASTSNQRRAIWSRVTTTNCLIADNNATNWSNNGGTAYYFQCASGGNVFFENNIGSHSYYPIDLLAAAALPVISVVQVEGSGGAVTCTATPSIADAQTVGTRIVILGEDDTNHWTIQDDDTLSGSNVQLGDTSRQLTDGDVLGLYFDGTYWQEEIWIDN